MTTITLSKIEIANFKGISQFEASFGHRTQIIGGNGTGKSTIPDAFHWCLFGTNAHGSTAFSVRPLDEHNNLIPDLEVKVSVTLSVGGRQTTFARILAAGKRDNAATYCVNGVPCKMSEFDEKLNAVCKKEDLKLLTSVTAFNALDTKTARAKLQQIAGTVSEAEVAAGLPALVAAFQEGKTAEELKRETAAKKSKSTDRLKQIPTSVNAQEELRSKAIDFNALRTKVAKKEKEIAAIDAQLTQSAAANQPQLDAAQADRTALNNLKADLQECDASIERDHNRNKAGVEDSKATATVSLANKQRAASALDDQIKAMDNEVAEHTKDLTKLGEEWGAVNEEEFNASLEPQCPTCKKPYTAQELASAQGTLIEQFNQDKLSRLGKITEKAKGIQDTKSATIATIEESKAALAEMRATSANLEATIKECSDKLSKLPSVEQAKAANAERTKLTQQIDELTTKINASNAAVTPTTNDDLITQKQVLQQEVTELNKELGKEAVDVQIDRRKAELLQEEKELAQVVADCDNIEAQIKAFSRRKIDLVEEAVASLFRIARFKMYEPNLTNDGEKEICECIVDGVPFGNLNTAKRVNAGLDIVNALSNAMGVIAPVFIDNKESVFELIDTPAQIIALKAIEGEQLTIINQ